MNIRPYLIKSREFDFLNWKNTQNVASAIARATLLVSNNRLNEIEKSTKKFMYEQYEQNKIFSRQMNENSFILKSINDQLGIGRAHV